MLIELRVSDLALVTSATVIFGPGLNLLTGETGSGKSLVVDALGLCLGARASADQIRHGADSAVVDAVFRLDGEESKAVLAEMGFGPADEVILTREVGRNSRARINGRPATPAQLRRIGGVLVGIHGQHEQQALLDPDAQTLLLDAFCGAGKLRSEVEAAYSTKLRQQRALSELLQLRARGHKEEEYLRWQLQELEAAELVDGEEQSLVAERAVVRHSARLGELTTQAGTFLLDDEGIAQAVSGLMNAVELDPRLVPVLTRLEAVVDEVSEAAAELRRYSEQLDSDPQRLEEIEARLSQLDSIRRRFGGSVEAAIEERDRLRLQVGRTADLDSAIEEASSGVERASEALTQAAGSLSALRDEGARTLGDAVGSELRDLRLEDSAFQIDLLPRLETGPTGAEQAQMMFSANPGEPLGVLARVASGGELARVMLAVKTVSAQAERLPTLIFDEVDTGIGGETALQVGLRLQALGRSCQVLVVTHLAQIAAFASHHLRVDKVPGADGRNMVRVSHLEGTVERSQELARMMGGAITEKAMARAEELLREAGSYVH